MPRTNETVTPSDVVVATPQDVAAIAQSIVSQSSDLKTMILFRDRLESVVNATDAELIARGTPAEFVDAYVDYTLAQLATVTKAVEALLKEASAKSYYLAGELIARQMGTDVSDDDIALEKRAMSRAIRKAGNRAITARAASVSYGVAFYYARNPDSASEFARFDTLEKAEKAARDHSARNGDRFVAVYSGSLRHRNVTTRRTFKSGDAV